MGSKRDALRQAGQRLDRALEWPAGTLGGGARIELHADREATVDGCRGILNYSDEAVRLNIGSGAVTFYGQGLTIRTLTDREAVLVGRIRRVEFNA